MAVDRRWPKGIYVRELPSVAGKIYSQVTVGDPGSREVHIAGTLPFDANQIFIGEGDVRAQTKAVMEHIGRSLAEFGLGPADVLRTKTYVIDMEDYLANGLTEWVEFFDGTPPTSTTVGVTSLADNRALVEIEAYAALPGQ
ncbi:RidA family protein [Parafrigoribacterium humi]|jgi:enamine deaminase RidA (YjgF/YER057c/UK114 family)|uniref:RidA family protein n=1 Tax=Parafrigoribacterium humi TaxID=3144664 RepID=UPI0032EBE9A2